MGNPFTHLTDERLMVLYQEGEHAAFEVLYARHKNRVYTYLAKRLHDNSVLLDLFQLVFMKFHKTRMKYDPKYPLVNWLYVLCRNILLDYIKKPHHDFVPIEEKYVTVEEQVDHRIDLNSEPGLNIKEKEAISLRYYSEKEFEEISEILNTSESNVRKIISRGIKKLRKNYLGGDK